MSRKKRRKNRKARNAGSAKAPAPSSPQAEDAASKAEASFDERPIDQRKAILGGCIVASGAGFIMLLVMIIGGSLYIRSVESRWTAEFVEQGFTKRSGTALVVSETLTAKTLLLGGSVALHGHAEDDVAIIAREATVTGRIRGTLFFRGGILRLAPTARVDGPLNLQASELVTNGARFQRVDGSVERLVDDSSDSSTDSDTDSDTDSTESPPR